MHRHWQLADLYLRNMLRPTASPRIITTASLENIVQRCLTLTPLSFAPNAVFSAPVMELTISSRRG